ncbi:unnamed protein product [Ixodes hexagonus]
MCTLQEELRYLTEHIATAGGCAIPVQDFILPSTSNVITALLFGTTYALDDPRRKYLVQHVTNFASLVASSSIVNFIPDCFSIIFAALPFSRMGAIRRSREILIDFVRDRVNEHKHTLRDDINRDFIDGYLKKIKEHQHESSSHFQESHLLGNAVDFYVGGAHTTASYIHWLLLVCPQKPDTVQSRIRREIDDIVGPERQPTWEDRKRLHFTMACLWEILRWKTVVPIGHPRGPREDTFIDEYVIVKGTLVMSNVMAVHRDHTLWERPDDFDPTRFLSSKGSFLPCGEAGTPHHIFSW